MKELFDNFRKVLIDRVLQYINSVKKISKTEFVNFFKKKSVLVSIILLISIIVGFSTVEITKNYVLNKFVESIQNNDLNVFSKCIKVEGKSVDNKELEPLLLYYSARIEELDRIIKEIKRDGHSGIFTLVNKKILGNDRYYININRINSEISSNIKEVIFEVDEKKYNPGDILREFIPGTYEIEYSVDSIVGEISGKKQVDLFNDDNINIPIPALYITLTSDFSDAKVHINNKDIGITVAEVKKYGPLPMDGSVQVHIEKEFPWGKIKSENVIIKDENFISININMANDKLIAKMENVSKEFYQSVFNALNSKDKNEIVNASNDVANKIYDNINEKSFILKNNYEISDLEVKIEKSDFKYKDGEYNASLVTSIKYSVFKKLLPFNKKTYEQMFLLDINYENGEWKINDIQKFALE